MFIPAAAEGGIADTLIAIIEKGPAHLATGAAESLATHARRYEHDKLAQRWLSHVAHHELKALAWRMGIGPGFAGHAFYVHVPELEMNGDDPGERTLGSVAAAHLAAMGTTWERWDLPDLDTDLTWWIDHKDHLPDFIQPLLACAWADICRRDRSKYPAIPEIAVEPLAQILAGAEARGDELRRHGRVWGWLRTSTAHPDMPDAAALTDALASVHAHRILRFVVSEAWLQGKTGDLATVVVDGGYRGLAARLGPKGRKAAVSVKDACAALSHLVIAAPTGDEPLISITEQVVGRTVQLRLEPLGILERHYIQRLKAATKTRRGLVPLPPTLPVITSSKAAARQASFNLLLLLHLRQQAVALRQSRAVNLAPWVPGPAAAMELSEAAAHRLLAEWSRTGPHRLLIRRSDAYGIAPEHQLLRDHLVQSARMTTNATQRRKRGRSKAP